MFGNARQNAPRLTGAAGDGQLEDKKFIVVLAVAVAVFLGLPLVLNAVKDGGASAVGGAEANPAASAPSASASAPAPALAAPPPQPVPPPAPVGASGLTASSLTGTAWEADTQYGAVQIQLNPGGQLSATHPMIGAIPGTWNVSGNQLSATASAMGQPLNINCEIRGASLIYRGKPLKRLR